MSDKDEAVLRLASTAFDDDGWLSDAQDAQLEWDRNSRSIYFCGEGSIDVGHLVEIVLAERGEDDERWFARHDAKVRAQVLRDASAASYFRLGSSEATSTYPVRTWLRDEADRIEREAGLTDV